MYCPQGNNSGTEKGLPGGTAMDINRLHRPSPSPMLSLNGLSQSLAIERKIAAWGLSQQPAWIGRAHLSSQVYERLISFQLIS